MSARRTPRPGSISDSPRHEAGAVLGGQPGPEGGQQPHRHQLRPLDPGARQHPQDRQRTAELRRRPGRAAAARDRGDHRGELGEEPQHVSDLDDARQLPPITATRRRCGRCCGGPWHAGGGGDHRRGQHQPHAVRRRRAGPGRSPSSCWTALSVSPSRRVRLPPHRPVAETADRLHPGRELPQQRHRQELCDRGGCRACRSRRWSRCRRTTG